ncbi:hypothetical protein NFI96_014147, partial [Prochilodus magdalenae]
VVFSPVVFVWSVPHTHSTTTTAFACIFQCFFCQQVQQSCNSSSASADEPSEENHDCEMVKMTKSKTFQAYLPNCHRTYSCIHCRAHLANHDELISKVGEWQNLLCIWDILDFYLVQDLLLFPSKAVAILENFLNASIRFSKMTHGGYHCPLNVCSRDCWVSEAWNKPAIDCRFSQDQSFQGSQGRAYLFNSVVNVGCGPAEERVLLTGLHAVADIYCENCKTTLGWKYEHAFESSQKYKEGKFIIELAHMIKDNGWE